MVPGRARRRAGQPRAGPLPLPRRPRRRRRRAAQRLGQHLRRPGLDPGDRGRRLARPVVPAPVRTRAARPRLDQPARCAPSSSRSCGSGSTAASTASASTSPTAWPRTRSCPTSAARLRRRRARPTQGHPHWDRDEVHDIYRGVAAGHRRVRRRPGVRRRGLGADARAARPLRAPRRAAHGVQLRLPARAAGTPTALRDGDRRRASPRWPASARRRPGCCPTTTSPATSPATAAASVGRRRARAAALLMLALPGGAYVYQGEELGLPEVADLPDELRQDPTFRRTGGARDGAATAAGCRSRGRATRRRSASARAGAAVAAAAGRLGGADRRAPGRPTRRRCSRSTAPPWRCAASTPALGDGTMAWLASPATCSRSAGSRASSCVVNLGTDPAPLPEATHGSGAPGQRALADDGVAAGRHRGGSTTATSGWSRASSTRSLVGTRQAT